MKIYRVILTTLVGVSEFIIGIIMIIILPISQLDTSMHFTGYSLEMIIIIVGLFIWGIFIAQLSATDKKYEIRNPENYSQFRLLFKS